jgi:hypothetical protein
VKVSRRDTIDRYYILEWRGWAVFIHHIKQSDPRNVMHTHPWSWVSLIFGSYLEERPGRKPRLRRFWNACRAGVPHRVTIDKPLWTILVHGPREMPWAVTNDAGEVLEVEPWTGTENADRTSYVR